VTSYTEQSFLEDFVFFIPKGKAGADVLMSVTVAANAIFTYRQYLSEIAGVTSDLVTVLQTN
jgi:hypothetical protein